MNIKFTQKTNGVGAVINGISAKDLNQKVSECKDGKCSCDCDPAMMQKIEKIDISTHEDGTHINIIGDIDMETIAPMMEKCLISDDKEDLCR